MNKVFDTLTMTFITGVGVSMDTDLTESLKFGVGKKHRDVGVN